MKEKRSRRLGHTRTPNPLFTPTYVLRFRLLSTYMLQPANPTARAPDPATGSRLANPSAPAAPRT